jgi:hypothetical protein
MRYDPDITPVLPTLLFFVVVRTLVFSNRLIPIELSLAALILPAYLISPIFRDQQVSFGIKSIMGLMALSTLICLLIAVII